MARPTLPLDLRLLSKVSILYYEQKLTQDEIAKKLHLSRPKVSRLLQQAEEVGIVRVSVHIPANVYSDLEQRLEEIFGLEEVVIAEVEENAPQEIISKKVGAAAAEYLQRTTQAGDTIGISWGVTLKSMVSVLQSPDVEDLHVVQLIGGLGPPEADTHVTEICRRMAHVLNSKLTLLPAPGVVGSVSMKEVILADSYVQNAFSQFSKINTAYVGIGVPSPESVVMQARSIISQEERQALLDKGAVGDIALRFFDRAGHAIQSDLDDRVIGVTLEQLRQIDRVVGVSGGPQKDEVILATLRGRLITVLVTDQWLATRLLHRVETEK